MPTVRMRRLRQVTPLATVVALAALGLIGAAVPGASGAVIRTAAGGAARADGHTAASGVTAATAAAPVKPVVACGQLATAAFDFAAVPDAPTYVFSAMRRKLAGAEYCLVSGYIAPQVQFALSLPVNTYKGLYMQLGR